METVSENTKRGKGRPRKFSDAELESAENKVHINGSHHGGMVETRRQWQNMAYACRAVKRLEAYCEEEPPEHYRLVDNCLTPLTDRGWFALYPEASQRVLTELGRIEEDDLFWRCVDWYAANADYRGSAEYASKIIRDLRLGRRSFRD